MRRLLASALIVLGAAGSCRNATAPSPSNLPGGTHVRVFNDSPYTLTNVRIDVSEDEHFTIASLEHGDLSADQGLHEMHETPAVTATANGKTFVANPVEGFAGFNPKLSPGSYVISIHIGGAPLSMTVTVTQPVEN